MKHFWPIFKAQRSFDDTTIFHSFIPFFLSYQGFTFASNLEGCYNDSNDKEEDRKYSLAGKHLLYYRGEVLAVLFHLLFSVM